jgi:hypothetical protein
VTKPTEDGHQHPVTRLDQRHQQRLDAGPRGAIDQQGALGGLEHLLEQRRRFVHVGGELWVELTEHRHRHGPQHARIDIDRAGSHQQARAGAQFGEQHGRRWD